MAEKTILKVHMFGGFAIQYGEKAVSFERNQAAKFVQLFQILMLYGERGISKSEMIHFLYGRDEVENGNSSLNNTIFRLRRQLRTAGLPETSYLTVQGGICRWKETIPVWTDVHEFERLLTLAEKAEGEERLSFLKAACEICRGEFLPSMAGEEWAAAAAAKYQKLYFGGMRTLLRMLKKRRAYEDMLKYAGMAAAIYPFEEWQLWKIDSLMAMDRYGEAMEEYQAAVERFFEDFGLPPSEEMLKRFRIMSGEIRQSEGTLNDIRKVLREKGDRAGGGYFCPFPSFIDGYRLLSRMMERSGQSVYIMLCTISDPAGRSIENKEKRKRLALYFKEAARYSLRKGDVYTRYSASQFLILLSGTKEEYCSVVSGRLTRQFREKGGGRNQIKYYVASIAEVESFEGKNGNMSFAGAGLWKTAGSEC